MTNPTPKTQRDEIQVGDTVWLYEPRRDAAIATVVKVGSTLVTLTEGGGWQERKFDMVTGYERIPNYTSASYFLTNQQRAVRLRVDAAKSRLSAAGMKLTSEHGYREVPITVEQWESIAEILVPTTEGLTRV